MLVLKFKNLLANILLLSHEDDFSSIFDLARNLKKDGHNILFIECSICYSTDLVFKTKKCKEIFKNSFYDIQEPVIKFEQNYINKKLEIFASKKLNEIEKKYLDGMKTIREIIRTDPMSFSDHHPRSPYSNIGDENIRNNYYLEILSWFIQKIENFKPDISFCYMGNYLLKDFSARVSRKLNYRHYIFTTSRIENYLAVLDRDYLPVNNPFLNEFQINNFKNKINIIIKESKSELRFTYKGTHYSKKVGEYEDHLKVGFLVGKKKIVEIKYFFKQFIYQFVKQKRNKKIKFRFFNSISNFVIIYLLKQLIKIIITYINYKKIFVSEEVIKSNIKNGMRYILLPLHVMPESSTINFSKNHHEENLIKYISPRLPANYNLLVKENHLMIGERDLDFYKNLKKLGNIKFIDPHLSPKKTLPLGYGLISICGTAILESILYGNHNVSIVGLPEYRNLIPEKYKDYNGIDNFINDLKSESIPKIEDSKIKNYLSYLISFDISWNLEKQLYVFFGAKRKENDLEKNMNISLEIKNKIISVLLKLTD